MKTCSIDGCIAKVFGRGWCHKHYMRWYKRGGDPSIMVLLSVPTQDRSIWKIRFDQKWKKSGDCWLWTGNKGKPSSKYAYTYGQFMINGKRTRAHRAAWMIYRSDIPEDLHVLHTCHNALCVNPDHLYLGNHEQNMRDVALSLRSAHLKLSPEQVRQIRMSQESSRILAGRYLVDRSTIKDIRNLKTRKHVVS